MESAGLDEKGLKDALEHDVAQKANAVAEEAAGTSANVVVHPGIAVTADDVDRLEVKQAYFAKAVAISYVDTAHACVRMAMQEVAPPLDTTNLSKADKKTDTKRVETLLNFGERAVKIAQALDHLGDKALVRYKAVTSEDPDSDGQQG